MNLSKLVVASSNIFKINEFCSFFKKINISLIPQSDLNIMESDEPHSTFLENALKKARNATRLSGLPAISDDSGLCVRALNGMPGVRSARYASHLKQSDIDNNKKLLTEMQGIKDRSAYYIAILVLMQHEFDPTPIIAEGIWHGEIIDIPRGNLGFGYDPLFYIPELQKTAGELNVQEKNLISHRTQAIKKLLQSITIRQGKLSL